jgi:hypothetical protein
MALDEARQSEARWRKARRSIVHSTCVEVAVDGSEIIVRHSKSPDGAVLRFELNTWRSFLDRVQNGGARYSKGDANIIRFTLAA